MLVRSVTQRTTTEARKGSLATVQKTAVVVRILVEAGMQDRYHSTLGTTRHKPGNCNWSMSCHAMAAAAAACRTSGFRHPSSGGHSRRVLSSLVTTSGGALRRKNAVHQLTGKKFGLLFSWGGRRTGSSSFPDRRTIRKKGSPATETTTPMKASGKMAAPWRHLCPPPHPHLIPVLTLIRPQFRSAAPATLVVTRCRQKRIPSYSHSLG